jgi:hypothetical protein
MMEFGGEKELVASAEAVNNKGQRRFIFHQWKGGEHLWYPVYGRQGALEFLKSKTDGKGQHYLHAWVRADEPRHLIIDLDICLGELKKYGKTHQEVLDHVVGELRNDIGAWLEQRGVDEDDAEYMLDQMVVGSANREQKGSYHIHLPTIYFPNQTVEQCYVAHLRDTIGWSEGWEFMSTSKIVDCPTNGLRVGGGLKNTGEHPMTFQGDVESTIRSVVDDSSGLEYGTLWDEYLKPKADVKCSPEDEVTDNMVECVKSISKLMDGWYVKNVIGNRIILGRLSSTISRYCWTHGQAHTSGGQDMKVCISSGRLWLRCYQCEGIAEKQGKKYRGIPIADVKDGRWTYNGALEAIEHEEKMVNDMVADFADEDQPVVESVLKQKAEADDTAFMTDSDLEDMVEDAKDAKDTKDNKDSKSRFDGLVFDEFIDYMKLLELGGVLPFSLVLRYFNSVIFAVMSGGDDITFTQNRDIDGNLAIKIVKKSLNASLDVVCQVMNKNGQMFPTLAKAYKYARQNNLVNVYRMPCFTPYPTVPRGNSKDLNLFRGFTAYNPNLEYKSPIGGKIDQLLKLHFKGETYDWFLMWVADMIQNPATRSNINVVLYSDEEGTGKGMVAEWISLIVGRQYSVDLQETKGLASKFNKILENRLMIHLDDIARDTGSREDIASFLRSFTTKKEIIIEPKGVDPYKTKLYAKLLISTNHKSAISISKTDRRTFINKMDGSIANDLDYFQGVKDELEDAHAIQCWFRYLQTEIKVNRKRVMRPPTTDLLAEAKVNKVELLSFIADCFSEEFQLGGEGLGNCEITKDEKETIIGIKVKATFLYQRYCRYQEETAYGGRKKSKRGFYGALEKLGLTINRNLSISGGLETKRQRGFHITRDSINRKVSAITRSNFTLANHKEA